MQQTIRVFNYALRPVSQPLYPANKRLLVGDPAAFFARFSKVVFYERRVWRVFS